MLLRVGARPATPAAVLMVRGCAQRRHRPHALAYPLCATAVFEGLPTTPQAGDKSWPHRLHKLFSSCSSGSSAGDCGMDGGGGSQPGTPATPLRLSPEELGEPDCLLAGAGWSIPVHRCGPHWGAWARGRLAAALPGLPCARQQRTAQHTVAVAALLTHLSAASHRPLCWPSHGPATRRSVLRQRCDQFRARCDTGWADCSADRVAVPEQFSREAVEALLHYVYHGGRGRGAGLEGGMWSGVLVLGRCPAPVPPLPKPNPADGMEECGDPQEVVGVLHVALYFSCPRLVHLCELRLAALLRGRDSRARLGAHTLDEEGERWGSRGGQGGCLAMHASAPSPTWRSPCAPLRRPPLPPCAGLADAAAALLSLADDNGLGHLRAVALDYIVHHHEACRKTGERTGAGRGISGRSCTAPVTGHGRHRGGRPR